MLERLLDDFIDVPHYHAPADAEQVFVFQRTQQWISPRDKYGKEVEPEIRDGRITAGGQ